MYRILCFSAENNASSQETNASEISQSSNNKKNTTLSGAKINSNSIKLFVHYKIIPLPIVRKKKKKNILILLFTIRGNPSQESILHSTDKKI